MLLAAGCSQAVARLPGPEEFPVRAQQAPSLEVAHPAEPSPDPSEPAPPVQFDAAPHPDGTGAGPPPGRTPGTATAVDPVETTPGAATGERPVHLVSWRDGPEPPTDLAAAILGAYNAFWDSYWTAAGHPVNPAHPGIERYSTEPLRSRAVGVLRGRAAEGVALRLPPDHGAGRIVHIEGWDHDGAELLDCFVDTAVLYEVSTGRVRNDERATVVHLALMRRQGGSWRVAEIFEQAMHTGRTGGCIMQANRRETLGPTGADPSPGPVEDAGRAARGQGSPW